MFLLCKHLCVTVLVQLCLYMLSVYSKSSPATSAGNLSQKVTQRPHTIKTSVHSALSGNKTPQKSVHSFQSRKNNKTNIVNRKSSHHVTPQYNNPNISSDEVYVDSSAPAEQSSSESVSFEHTYANVSDITANETFWLKLDDAFEILTEKKYDHMSSVHALMNAYKFSSRKKRFRSLPYGRQQPFVTIEGFDNDVRSTLADHLAELMEGKLLLNPTPDFRVILKDFGNNTELKRCYLTLTTHVTAMNARKTIETDPAITSGYYLTEAAFVAAQLYFPHLPPKNSSFWTWPPELFKPDMIFFLLCDVDLNPNEELDAESLIIKNSVMEIFTLWNDPPCIAIQDRQNYSIMLEEMIPHLNTILS